MEAVAHQREAEEAERVDSLAVLEEADAVRGDAVEQHQHRQLAGVPGEVQRGDENYLARRHDESRAQAGGQEGGHGDGLDASEAEGGARGHHELDAQEVADLDAGHVADPLLDYDGVAPDDVGQHSHEGEEDLEPAIGDGVVLEGGSGLEGGVDERHQEVSVDVDEYACEADGDAYGLQPVDGDAVDVVVDEEDEQRPSDGDGVDEREGEHEVHGRVDHLVQPDEGVPDQQVLEVSRPASTSKCSSLC